MGNSTVLIPAIALIPVFAKPFPESLPVSECQYLIHGHDEIYQVSIQAS